MNKQLLTLAATILMAVQGTVCAQNPTITYYNEDFQSGKPQNMIYLDGDGRTITDELKGTGLECGTWHIVRNSYTDTNFFMASTSSFSEPGKANDWMITPNIKIYGEGATLTWKSMSLSAVKKDGIKVYISTSGYSMEDFEAEPIFTSESESAADWQTHNVRLDKYAGKFIHIAFVNDSYDKYVLCLDDIKVTGPVADVDCRLQTPIMTDTGKAQMAFALTNNYADVINHCKMIYIIDGQTFTKEFTGLNLTKGNSTVLTDEKEISVPLNTTCHYEAWMEIEGDRYASQYDSIRGTYFISNRRTLLEEGTGNWCSNCPAGEVAMHYMEENYPDNVVVIAIHGGQPTEPMIFEGYINFLGYTGFPTVITDRKWLSVPMNMDDDYNFSLMEKGVEYYYQLAQRELAEAELNGTAVLTDPTTNKIEINLNSRFVNDFKKHEFDIALILSEDSVTAPNGSMYVQENAYSQSVYQDVAICGLKDTLPACGGWAYQKAQVRTKFNHVARAAYNGSFAGYENDDQLPATLQGGILYNSQYTWEITEGVVNNIERTSIVALMTDATGSIVNCCKMPVVTDPNAIDRVKTSSDATITAIYAPNGAQVNALQPGLNIVTYTDAQGRTFTRKVLK